MFVLTRAVCGFRRILNSTLSKQHSTYNLRDKYRGPLKTAILDWSGTTADKYVIATAIVFYNVFV